MSTKSDSDVAEARDQLRSDFDKNGEAPVAGGGEREDDASSDDPLSAYLEEVQTDDGMAEPSDEGREEEAAAVQAPPAPLPGKDAAAPSSDIEPLEGRRSIAELKSQRAQAKSPAYHAPAAVERSAAAETPAPEAQRPRVIVESGGRSRSRGGALDFGRAGQAEPPEPSASSPGRTASEPTPERRGAFAKPQPVEVQPSAVREAEEEIEAPAARPAQSAPVRADARPSRLPKLKGRLFGWLVSYGDPDGSAIELREGKFFVSRSSLKNNDMLIDHESISTPHAMVVVDPDHGLRIQDLMSERGIFIRKRGVDTYRREEDILIAENGDWVRIGDVEFLVSLVPYVGIK